MKQYLIIVIPLIGILVASIIGMYVINTYYPNLILSDPLISCYRTGGKVRTSGGSQSGMLACGKYPKNQSERIENEKYPRRGTLCPTVVTKQESCICSTGKYFGSYEEGCIPLSEKRAVIRERW